MKTLRIRQCVVLTFGMTFHLGEGNFGILNISDYSSVPNRRVGPNNPVGWIFHGKLVNV